LHSVRHFFEMGDDPVLETHEGSVLLNLHDVPIERKVLQDLATEFLTFTIKAGEDHLEFGSAEVSHGFNITLQ
jgi:hypothetical protein